MQLYWLAWHTDTKEMVKQPFLCLSVTYSSSSGNRQLSINFITFKEFKFCLLRFIWLLISDVVKADFWGTISAISWISGRRD